MSRGPGAVTARLRLALAMLVGGALALLLPTLSATTTDSASAVVLGLVAATVAALHQRRQHVVAPRSGAGTPQPRTTDPVPSLLAGLVTDPAHHPLRPRAPGLV